MLTYCTLTGVDAKTDVRGIFELSEEFPFAEFGILYSADPEGKGGRYPSRSEIERLARSISTWVPKPHLALHVCGRAVLEFLDPASPIHDMAADFGRVQLNFNASVPWMKVAELDRAISAFPGKVITQHNAANALVSAAIKSPNHQVLFDASGGRGLKIADWPVPLPGKECGYAGGFGPATIADDVARSAAAAGGGAFWIDMETQLRTEDRFDLAACRTVLEAVSKSGFAADMERMRTPWS